MRVGTEIADKIKSYLTDGVILDAVNFSRRCAAVDGVLGVWIVI